MINMDQLSFRSDCGPLDCTLIRFDDALQKIKTIMSLQRANLVISYFITWDHDQSRY